MRCGGIGGLMSDLRSMSLVELRKIARELGINASGRVAAELVRDIEKKQNIAEGKATPADADAVAKAPATRGATKAVSIASVPAEDRPERVASGPAKVRGEVASDAGRATAGVPQAVADEVARDALRLELDELRGRCLALEMHKIGVDLRAMTIEKRIEALADLVNVAAHGAAASSYVEALADVIRAITVEIGAPGLMPAKQVAAPSSPSALIFGVGMTPPEPEDVPKGGRKKRAPKGAPAAHPVPAEYSDPGVVVVDEHALGTMTLEQLTALAHRLNAKAPLDAHVQFTGRTTPKELRAAIIEHAEHRGTVMADGGARMREDGSMVSPTAGVPIIDDADGEGEDDDEPGGGAKAPESSPEDPPDYMRVGAKVDVDVESEGWQPAAVQIVDVEAGTCHVVFDDGCEGDAPWGSVRPRDLKAKSRAAARA